MFGIGIALAMLAQSRPAIAFRHVAVVDVRSGRILHDQTVIVAGHRILAVGLSRQMPPGAEVVEARGKFLIPGLWDMHAHNDDDRNTRRTILPLMIANGVTGIRDMCADVYPANNPAGIPLEVVDGWRKDIAAGKLVGPRIVAGSTLVDGPKGMWPEGSLKVSNADEGRAAADYVKGRGNDFLKVYSDLPRDGYLELAKECRRIGLVFAGHVPESVTAIEASNEGQKSIEHLMRVIEGCSTEPVDPDRPNKQLYMKPAADKLRLVKTFSPSLANKQLAAFVKNRTWQCPTLTVIRSSAFRDISSFRHDPRNALLPKSMTSDWQVEDKYWVHTKKPYWAATRKLWRLELRVVGMMARAHVPILAGTDAPTNFTYPGSSLQDELQLLVQAGLTPLQALQSATLGPAEYFGRMADMGTVEPGKLADLVLLDGNPLSDTRNTCKIRAVVADGRYYSREDLKAIMDSVHSAAH